MTQVRSSENDKPQIDGLISTNAIASFSRIRFHEVLWALLLIAFAATVRLARVDTKLGSFDEFFSLYAASGGRTDIGFTTPTKVSDVFKPNLTTVAKTTAVLDSGNALGYHLALACWLRITGISLRNARLFSCVIGALTVGLVFFIMNRVCSGMAPPIWAALLLAIHPLHVAFSTTSRSYALATFFVALTFLLLLYLASEDASSWLVIGLYGVLVTATLLSHLLTVYILVPQTLILAWLCRKSHLRWKLGVVWTIVSAGMCLILAYEGTIGRLIQRSGQWNLVAATGKAHDVSVSTPTSLASAVFVASLEYLGLHVYWVLLEVVKARYAVIPIALILIAIGVSGYSWWRGPVSRSFLYLSIIGFLAPFIFGLAGSMITGHTVAAWPQYSVFCVPWVGIFLAVGLVRSRISIALAVIYGVILSLGCAIPAWPRQDDPFTRLSTVLLANTSKGDSIAVPNVLTARVLALFLRPDMHLSLTTGQSATTIFIVRSDGQSIAVSDLDKAGVCAFSKYFCLPRNR
jgi:uncharacterized membrane protein